MCLISSLSQEPAAIRAVQKPAKLLRNRSGALLCWSDVLLRMKRFCASSTVVNVHSCSATPLEECRRILVFAVRGALAQADVSCRSPGH